jgi:hypothetical protein
MTGVLSHPGPKNIVNWDHARFEMEHLKIEFNEFDGLFPVIMRISQETHVFSCQRWEQQIGWSGGLSDLSQWSPQVIEVKASNPGNR